MPTADEIYAQSLFERAENERQYGSSLVALPIYREILRISCPSTSLWLKSMHMDAVCRRSLGRHRTSLAILDILLGDPRPQLDQLLLAHLLRDKAETLRKLKNRCKEAYTIATESFELFVEHDGSLSQIGASRGFLARIAWDQNDREAALAMSGDAALELQAGDVREVELYHLVFHAYIVAHCEPSAAPYFAACGLQLCEEGFGNSAQRKRLETIRDNISDPKTLDKAMAKLEKANQ